MPNVLNPVLIDYDDTMFPTTYLDYKKISVYSKIEPNSILSKELNKLDKTVKKFLTTVGKYGNPIIFTNAEEGWVTQSCEFFMPKTYKYILENDIQIQSARDKYSKITEDHSKWKINLLMEHLDYELYGRKFLLSIGDSEYEREAALNYCNCSKGLTSLKNILINPDVFSMDATIKGLTFLSNSMKGIISYDFEIDMILELGNGESNKSPRDSQIGPLTPTRK